MNKFIKSKSHYLNNSHSIPLVIFIVFVSIYFASTVGIMNSGDAPQYALTQALVEDKIVSIDKYGAYINPDYALYKNKKYSLRTIGESLFMIPFYLWAKIALPFSSFPYNSLDYSGITQSSKLEALTSLTNATFGTLMLVVIYLFIIDLTNNNFSALLTVITGGLGTLFWRYSSHMQRFPIVSFFLILSFYLFYKISIEKKKNITPKLILLGFSLGCAVMTDLTVFPISIVILLLTAISVRRISKLFKSLFFLSFYSIPLFIMMLYNFLAFEKPFTTAYSYHAQKAYYRNITNYYSVPLIPSFITNLINYKPIPPYVFGEIWYNFDFRTNEGMSIISSYKNYYGIFIQTPVLIFAIFGLISLIKKNRLIGLLLLTIPVIYIAQTSKYIAFYGPNSFDTHYFLPAIPFLLIGLGISIAHFLKLKNKKLKFLILTLIFLATIISVYNGWYSNLTNFAPHVTGEHRFTFHQLIQPWYFSWDIIKYNTWILFINTFPNIYNLPVLFAFYFLPLSLIYIIFSYVFHRKKYEK